MHSQCLCSEFFRAAGVRVGVVCCLGTHHRTDSSSSADQAIVGSVTAIPKASRLSAAMVARGATRTCVSDDPLPAFLNRVPLL